jgi:hypothetical protein
VVSASRVNTLGGGEACDAYAWVVVVFEEDEWAAVDVTHLALSGDVTEFNRRQLEARINRDAPPAIPRPSDRELDGWDVEFVEGPVAVREEVDVVRGVPGRYRPLPCNLLDDRERDGARLVLLEAEVLWETTGDVIPEGRGQVEHSELSEEAFAVAVGGAKGGRECRPIDVVMDHGNSHVRNGGIHRWVVIWTTA